MKKQVLIAAIGAALAAGPMVASAGATVFGHMHLSFDIQDSDSSAANSEQGYIASNSSRVGIKGDEALGGGLKAIYQYEIPFNADANATLSNTRSSWVGLSGVFGAAKLGKHDSPYKSVGRSIDPFNERIGDARNVYTTNSSRIDGGFRNNSVYYETPTFAGVKVAALYATDEGAQNGTNAHAGASVSWNWGGLYLAGAYANAKTPGVTAEHEEGLKLVGRYTFGFGLAIFGSYEKQDNLNGVNGADRDIFGGGATFKFGNNSIHGQYYTADASNTAGTNGGSMIAVAYDYNFSKTTRVYLAYAQTDNDSGTNVFTPAGSGHGDAYTNQAAVPAGGSPKAYSAGMIIDF